MTDLKGANDAISMEIVLTGSTSVNSIKYKVCGEASATTTTTEATTTEATTTEDCILDTVLDFEGLNAGAIVTNQFAEEKGVSVTCSGHACMIFDSSNPTGGDSDLGSPNADCAGGGPGVGRGGKVGEPGENCDPLGKILILSEDGDATDPDDDEDGGTMTFAFTECVELVSMSTLDNQGTETITVDVRELIYVYFIPSLGLWVTSLIYSIFFL